MSNHKIKIRKLVTKEALAEKNETGILPKKHSDKGKNFIPKNIDLDQYKKICRLRNKNI